MTDFVRYLRAKRSVDDRALNRRVWERLRAELARLHRQSIEVVDVGAGIATGAERMRDWSLFPAGASVRYVAVEPRAELGAEARDRLQSLPFNAEFVVEDLSGFTAFEVNEARFDLVVAHALLDILDLRTSVALLVRLARPGGLLYLPITFDGDTIFEPHREDDDLILGAYHDTMEEKGSSRTGRRLFHALRQHPVDILEIGGSDWIVHPAAGAYPQDEAFFLGFIVKTIATVLRGRVPSRVLDPWAGERLRQIEEGNLLYCAHQLDLLAKKRGGP